MVVLVGIDEAGFGPLLGPLVVSSTAFLLPDRLVKADLWRLLRNSVGRRRKALVGRLLIGDSKKVFNRSVGIGQLERTVLTCLRCLGVVPGSLAELLAALCPDCLERLAGYPWYKDLENRVISVDEADLRIISTVFDRDLASNGMKLFAVRSQCLDVAHYNRMVSGTRNKASVLFTATCRLAKRAFDGLDFDRVSIVVDRQGGRVRYGSVLRRNFADMEMAILRESPACSSYELKAGGRTMRLHFAAGADERFLPVSLASMVSKYLRELLMAAINRYFAALAGDLRPTAGYWKDGLRFVADLRKNVPAAELDMNRLVRCR
jgi:ribonuclease HII